MRIASCLLIVGLCCLVAQAADAGRSANRWMLVPGVNCSVADYRAIFGAQNLLTLGGRFDDTWKESMGSTQVSADRSGALASSGRTYKFAMSHGRAAVVKYYTAPNSEPLQVGLNVRYTVITDRVLTQPSDNGTGGAYARNLLWLRVTDTDTGKSLMKWVLNHGHASASVFPGETYDTDEDPLTFMLIPGHRYKLEAIVETIAAGYADPSDNPATALDTGQGEATLAVMVTRLELGPANPPWVSIWCTNFVPRVFDTYDRYERALLTSTQQHYFPSEFRVGVSAGGDYAPSGSFVKLTCPNAQVVGVTGDLQSVAQINPGRAYFPLPPGGGTWRTQMMLDCEVDPLKVPVMPLPAPLVEYLLATESLEVDRQTMAMYDPSHWYIAIGGELVPFPQWGTTGAIARALVAQHAGPVAELNWDQLYIENPRTGQTIKLSDLPVPNPNAIPHLQLDPRSAPDPNTLKAIGVNRRVIYSEMHLLQFDACAANGPDFKDHREADVKYEAVFDFIPRPMNHPLQANVGLGEL